MYMRYSSDLLFREINPFKRPEKLENVPWYPDAYFCKYLPKIPVKIFFSFGNEKCWSVYLNSPRELSALAT
jgi:hypothetical protein